MSETAHDFDGYEELLGATDPWNWAYKLGVSDARDGRRKVEYVSQFPEGLQDALVNSDGIDTEILAEYERGYKSVTDKRWASSGWSNPFLGADPTRTQAAVRKVLTAVRDASTPPPPLTVVPADHDAGADPLADVLESVMVYGDLPLLSHFYVESGAQHRDPISVRVDSAESFVGFRSKHSPDLAALRAKVDELQHRLDDHMADPHAHEEAQAELALIGAEVAESMDSNRVPVSLPGDMERDDKVQAWTDGERVYASICVPGCDGDAVWITGSKPIDEIVEEVEDYCDREGVTHAEILGAMPSVCGARGAGSILPKLAAAAPAVLDLEETADGDSFAASVAPASDPAFLAVCELAKACKAGDKQACAEWERLCQFAAHDDHLADAVNDASTIDVHTEIVGGVMDDESRRLAREYSEGYSAGKAGEWSLSWFHTDEYNAGYEDGKAGRPFNPSGV